MRHILTRVLVPRSRAERVAGIGTRQNYRCQAEDCRLLDLIPRATAGPWQPGVRTLLHFLASATLNL